MSRKPLPCPGCGLALPPHPGATHPTVDAYAVQHPGRPEPRAMKVTRVALVFACGYIIGARAGRERYAQIARVAEKTAKRLEEFSSKRPPGGSAGMASE